MKFKNKQISICTYLHRAFIYFLATGYFMCTVETAKKCIDLCQQTGCNDLYFMSVIPSKNDKIKRNYRCRCFQDYHVCFYNPLPRYHNIN